MPPRGRQRASRLATRGTTSLRWLTEAGGCEDGERCREESRNSRRAASRLIYAFDCRYHVGLTCVSVSFQRRLQFPDRDTDRPPPRSQNGSEERVVPGPPHDCTKILRSNLGPGFSGSAPWYGLGKNACNSPCAACRRDEREYLGALFDGHRPSIPDLWLAQSPAAARPGAWRPQRFFSSVYPNPWVSARPSSVPA